MGRAPIPIEHWEDKAAYVRRVSREVPAQQALDMWYLQRLEAQVDEAKSVDDLKPIILALIRRTLG